MNFDVHLIETAPEASREILASTQKVFCFVPNLLGVMAESPALLRAYRTIGEIFEQASFTPTERQVVLLTVSYQNVCNYCAASRRWWSTPGAGPPRRTSLPSWARGIRGPRCSTWFSAWA